jgi:sugar lactone lactonase YvrE
MSADVQLWDAGGYELGEGARRVGDRLIFVDILTGRLLESSLREPGPARVLAQLDVPLGTVAPVADRPDTWIVAAGTGIAILSADSRLEWLDRPEDGGSIETRMNDGACDAAGRFWAGSMAYDETPGAGSLYRTDLDGTVTRILDGFTIVNGPAFDAAGEIMYVADTPTGRIFRYDIGAAGNLRSGDLFLHIDAADGAPDGMTVDDAGRLWVALWGGSAVRCYGADGLLQEVVALPTPQPTSVCLGEPGDDQLFITTAHTGLGSASPEAGALFCAAVHASAPDTRPWLGNPPTGSL